MQRVLAATACLKVFLLQLRLLLHYAALHEDMERLERLVVRDFKQEKKGHKERLQQNHRVRNWIDKMQDEAKRLVRLPGLLY